jgi:hypothetical protein
MAGPKSSTPRPVRASRPKRRFSLAEANSTLPLVKRIVGDIVRTHGLVLKYQGELERLTSSKDPSATQSRLDEAVNHLEDYVDELTDVGCELKDYQVGLIDFVGRHQRRDVYLCWKLGEERIGYWHEINAGYAGRQPISTLKEDAE